MARGHNKGRGGYQGNNNGGHQGNNNGGYQGNNNGGYQGNNNGGNNSANNPKNGGRPFNPNHANNNNNSNNNNHQNNWKNTGNDRPRRDVANYAKFLLDNKEAFIRDRLVNHGAEMFEAEFGIRAPAARQIPLVRPPNGPTHFQVNCPFHTMCGHEDTGPDGDHLMCECQGNVPPCLARQVIRLRAEVAYWREMFDTCGQYQAIMKGEHSA